MHNDLKSTCCEGSWQSLQTELDQITVAGVEREDGGMSTGLLERARRERRACARRRRTRGDGFVRHRLDRALSRSPAARSSVPVTALRWRRSSPCAEKPGAALVPQGGNTGLVGGGVPLAGEVVLSLRRLAGVTDVDPLGGQLSVGAGTTIADVQAAAASAGWSYGVDLASRDSATIGGTIATNAGGLQVLRHGSTRAQLVGFEAVLGTGETVSHMGGLIKDNTGYDLGGLLCGSEGTLGVVTAARLRLVPQSPERVTSILAFSSMAAAADAASLLRRSLPELQSLEFFLQAGLDLVCRTSGIAPPFTGEHRAYLLAEAAAAQHDPMPAMAAVLNSVAAVEDIAVATDSVRRAQLWRYREGHTEAINTLGAPHKLDVTLPAPMLAAFIDDVPDIIRDADPRATTWLFGHVGDGNVHVNVTGIRPDDSDRG